MEEKAYSGPERRKTPRKETELQIRYMPRLAPGKAGKAGFRRTMCVHIGVGGLCMYADSPYPVDSKLLVVIILPGGKDTIATDAKVVYAKRVNEGEGRDYRIGLRFMNINKGDLTLITDFLKAEQKEHTGT